TSGVTRPASRSIWRGASAPNSHTRNSVVSVTRSIVSGAPTALLYDATGATVSPSSDRIARSMFFVVVLPLDPVIPTIFRRPRAPGRDDLGSGLGDRLHDVVDEDLRDGLVDKALDEREHGARLAGAADELVAVGHLARLRDEDVAFRDVARVGVDRARDARLE